MEIPCKNCITYPICKIDAVTSASQCHRWISRLCMKCSILFNYVESPDLPIEQLERMLDVILYLSNENIKVNGEHLVFYYNDELVAYYCTNTKKFFEVARAIICPYCGRKSS